MDDSIKDLLNSNGFLLVNSLIFGLDILKPFLDDNFDVFLNYHISDSDETDLDNTLEVLQNALKIVGFVVHNFSSFFFQKVIWKVSLLKTFLFYPIPLLF
jgi:hypothetical protein